MSEGASKEVLEIDFDYVLDTIFSDDCFRDNENRFDIFEYRDELEGVSTIHIIPISESSERHELDGLCLCYPIKRTYKELSFYKHNDVNIPVN